MCNSFCLFYQIPQRPTSRHPAGSFLLDGWDSCTLYIDISFLKQLPATPAVLRVRQYGAGGWLHFLHPLPGGESVMHLWLTLGLVYNCLLLLLKHNYLLF